MSGSEKDHGDASCSESSGDVAGTTSAGSAEIVGVSMTAETVAERNGLVASGFASSRNVRGLRTT